MKEKILQALNNKYKNLGFGDKAFDGVADYLSKTITEESQIETAIAGVEGLLKSFQGDIDKVRGEKSNLQKELDELKTKASGAAPTTTEPPKADNDLDAKIAAIVNQAVQTAVTPYAQKIQNFEAKEQQANRQNIIANIAKELGIPEWRMKEGFVIAPDADEATIKTILSGVKQNIVTAGLERGIGFPSSDKEPTKEEIADLAKSLI